MLGFLGGIWGRITAVAAAVAIGAFMVWRLVAGIKASGRREQALEDANAGMQGRLDAKEKVDEVRDDVRGLDAAERLERLRENERRARGGTP